MTNALDLEGDLVTLLRDLVDIELVSGDEAGLADQVERALTRYDHLDVSRDGTWWWRVRSWPGRAGGGGGALDTVPIAADVPSWVTDGADGVRVSGAGELRHEGRGGRAAAAAAALTAPTAT